MTSQPKTATEVTLAQQGNASASQVAGGRRAAPPNSLWIDLYSILLVGVILAYYTLMIYFAGKLFVWTVELIRSVFSTGFNLWTIPGALAIVVLMFLCMRTVRHLIYASAGLVTTVHDDVPEASEGLPLDRDEQPQLFETVEDVGQQVGSPMPNEIRVMYAPETYTVELRKFGLSPQRRLVMVLGLPQLSVLTVAELRVVLAHELAHFGRGDTRLIVFCSRFLASLQRSIDAIGHRWWHWVDPIYWFQLGYQRAFALLSAPVQRHQELRADCISAATFGGDLAARTLLKDCLLSHQFMAALASYYPGENGQTGDNFFRWFRSQWHDFTPSGQDYLLRRLEAEERESFWDPDPTISQRVSLMRTFPTQEAQPAQAASELIEGLPALENRLHELMY